MEKKNEQEEEEDLKGEEEIRNKGKEAANKIKVIRSHICIHAFISILNIDRGLILNISFNLKLSYVSF